ncbi:MAG: hypothetical protein ACI8R4_002832 [Paracoccaceae bacterium]|jgi:hypothetical protein
MIVDIWSSFRRMPGWVQIWAALILVPVNLAPLAFLGQPVALWVALWVAVLSVGGMLPNLWIMLAERGLSKRMAVPHVFIWTPLVVLVGWVLISGPALTPRYTAMLWVLLMVDMVSLGFDYVDAIKWRNGDRAIA